MTDRQVLQESLGSTQSLHLPGQPSLSPYVMCSLSPSTLDTHSDHSLPPGTFNRSRSGSNVSIYNQLQFPSTSNYGSMKRKKRGQRGSEPGDRTDRTATPPSSSPDYRESEYYDNNVRVWSLEYVPRGLSVVKKTVKV